VGNGLHAKKDHLLLGRIAHAKAQSYSSKMSAKVHCSANPTPTCP